MLPLMKNSKHEDTKHTKENKKVDTTSCSLCLCVYKIH